VITAEETQTVDYSLELVVVPVSDVDRAKAFYSDKMGFHVDVDHSAGVDFRIVQLTPPGSACSVTIMRSNEMPAGSLHGLHFCVSDIEAARAELVGRGTDVSDFFHFGEAGQTPGLDPERRNYGSYASIKDPDGNTLLLQEVDRSKAEA
jgi:catechol 2,3-dioxygenase-like lactoylglutathione lyase family enzyme